MQSTTTFYLHPGPSRYTLASLSKWHNIPHTSKLLYSHVSPLRFNVAKIRGLNSHLVYPKQHQLDRSSVLDLVSANHQSLQDINAIATSGQGNFLTGLGKLIGIAVHSLSKGGSTIIYALGHGIKDGFSGLGTFNHAVVTGLGNASGTILRSTGHALKDTSEGASSLFHSILGGLGGSLIWTILTILILFFVYRKIFTDKPFSFRKRQLMSSAPETLPLQSFSRSDSRSDDTVPVDTVIQFSSPACEDTPCLIIFFHTRHCNPYLFTFISILRSLLRFSI